jgi:hypothetical protein
MGRVNRLTFIIHPKVAEYRLELQFMPRWASAGIADTLPPSMNLFDRKP